jgi:hypothetical protein
MPQGMAASKSDAGKPAVRFLEGFIVTAASFEVRLESMALDEKL